MKLKKKLNGITKYLKQNNMKTKLEVGKEYWLSEQKISIGIYQDSLDAASSNAPNQKQNNLSKN